MHITKEYLLALGLIVLFTFAIFAAQFGIGMSGGIGLNSTAPTSSWLTTSLNFFGFPAFITDTGQWIYNAITFQLVGVGTLISTLMWMWTLITIGIPTLLIVRGD